MMPKQSIGVALGLEQAAGDSSAAPEGGVRQACHDSGEGLERQLVQRQSRAMFR
jgi:hypothetical protein